jgi:Uma2 family endonuclease
VVDPLANISRTNETHILWPLMQGLPKQIFGSTEILARSSCLFTVVPNPLEDQRFEAVPDWVCEILSPSTESKDRKIKMPLYAHHGVAFAWLVDPIAHTLETYRLEAGDWREIGRFSDGDQVAVAPFEAVTLELDGLWLTEQQSKP